MATAYGYYDNSSTGEQFCFSCAVKQVVGNEGDRISFQADGYEYHQCHTCGNFIEDRVEL